MKRLVVAVSLFVGACQGNKGAPGTFTFEVIGQLAISDPDSFDSESLLGRIVTLQVAQLKKQ